MAVVKLAEKVKPPRPTKAAIGMLKKDPSLARDFDAKFGAGTAALYLQNTSEMVGLLRDLVDGQAELAEQIAKLIEVVKAPRQVFMDGNDDVRGAVPMMNYRLDEDANEWMCTRCEKTQDACTCDDGDESIKA